MMPEMGGYNFCVFTAGRLIPYYIILNARMDENDKVLGLGAWAQMTT